MSRLETACQEFLHTVQACLKSKSMASCCANIDLDVWQYITYQQGVDAEHKGHKLYEKADFRRFLGLPNDWFYILNQHGEGIAIHFPIKAKVKVSWSPSRFVLRNGKLEVAPRIPLEKVTNKLVKRACNIDNILM